MELDAILSDDAARREAALAAASSAPEHARSALAGPLGAVAREAAGAVARDPSAATRLGRACVGLSTLRVEAAKSTLLRIADEGTREVKATLAGALIERTSPEGRAVLVHLLSDDDALEDAVRAIGTAPWPEVLPALMEIAEADDRAARIAAPAIAKCGLARPKETYAAADFLLELLDEEAVLAPAADALLRFGDGFPGVAERARRLAREPGNRKFAGLCLVAAYGDEGNAAFLELALAGTKADDAAARAFLGPLLDDPDERVRGAARRTWKALDLRPAPPDPR